MSWIIALVLALVSFAIAAFGFRLDRRLYTTMLAALALGLAGYALQASPGVPAAPKPAVQPRDESDFDIVEARREMLSAADQSSANMIVVADGMARQGQFASATEFLSGLTRENPQDFEAWLAQGNAMVELADGVLTPAALYSYRKAASLKPNHPAPGYFLGVSLIRQGQMMEARQVWAETLAAAPEDAVGRAPLAERLGRLDGLLGLDTGGSTEEAPN